MKLVALAEGNPTGIVDWTPGHRRCLGCVTDPKNTSRIFSHLEWILQGEVISRAKREV